MAKGQQLKILLGVVAAGFLGSAMVGAAYYWEKVVKPQREVSQRMEVRERDGFSAKPDPGRKEYAAARELIRGGDLFAARERLAYLMRYYSDSVKYDEAKRILGEINVDLLVSTSPAPGKVHYTVQRGDSLSRIASQYGCTLDFIMRANGRKNTILQVGDKLWVAPLHFALEADVSERTLTAYRTSRGKPSDPPAESGEEFFKEYPIVELDLPPTVPIPYETSISEKTAWAGSRPMGFSVSRPSYHTAHRWLQTRKPGLVIQPVPEDLENASFEKRTGILLAEGDLKELYTIIRTGTPLRLVD